ncbi:MAG: co-chaperone YbbN [Proteobacteria bacterium]|nr:MAG: co-chaperone YbbN [Pseudomonadota bacterium]
MAKSQWIEETTSADFVEKVLERSAEVPVLVDFWAPWCGPCRSLAPLLEAAVDARGGAVRLCKLNTDENQELAQRFGIRGVPAVKAFVDGEVRDEFVGLLDRLRIEAFLDRLIPSPAKQTLRAAEEALASGDHATALTSVGPLFGDREHGDRARLLAARAKAAAKDLVGAREVLAEIAEDGDQGDAASALSQRLELLEAAARERAQGRDEAALHAAIEDDPKDHEARWGLAAQQYARGAFSEALESLLELLARARGFRDDGPRRAMLAIFDELGPNHDLVGEARRRMQIYL